MHKSRKTIIGSLEKIFKEEEKKEPFADREYTKESKRIFNLLKESHGDFLNPTDRATYDIVTDIINYHDPKWKKQWVK